MCNIKDKGTETSFKTTVVPDTTKLKDSFVKQGLLTWVGEVAVSLLQISLHSPREIDELYTLYIKHLK